MPGGIHPPLEVIFSWPAPNYENPVTRPKTVLILACVSGPFTLALMLARLWVRIRVQRSAGWDDWLMAAAIFPTMALTVVFPYVTEVGNFNKHVWDVPPDYYVTQRKWVLVVETVFCVATGLIKISILLFYRRLSARAVSNGFRWVTWICIGFIAAYSIAFTIVPIFGCQPIDAFWNQVDFIKRVMGYEYKCFNEGADVFAAAVISAVQDLITAILPTFIYWNLQIPLRQKMALFGIFAIGYGVAAIGGLRAYYSWNLFFETYDVTWHAWPNYLWTMMELHIGAMCANAPALKVFLKHTLGIERLTGRSKSSQPKNASSTPSNSSKASSTLDKLSFWKHDRTKNNRGYLGEPHNGVSVDSNGVVQVQKEIHISHSPVPFADRKRNSIHGSEDLLNSLYDDDIEMGSFETDRQDSDSRSVRDEEAVIALPPMSSQPPPLVDATPRPPPAAKHSLSPFPQRNNRSTWH